MPSVGMRVMISRKRQKNRKSPPNIVSMVKQDMAANALLYLVSLFAPSGEVSVMGTGEFEVVQRSSYICCSTESPKVGYMRAL